MGDALQRLFEVHNAILDKMPKGPHLVKKDIDWRWCGGPGLCAACDDGRGVTLEEVFAWRDLTGWMSALAFGKHGQACCSAATYEELKAGCTTRTVQPSYTSIYFDPTLCRGLNSFSVYVADEPMADGILAKRNNKEKENEDTNG